MNAETADIHNTEALNTNGVAAMELQSKPDFHSLTPASRNLHVWVSAKVAFLLYIFRDDGWHNLI